MAVKLTMYQVDAFAASVFAGNPAAVCPLDAWLSDATMQAIAAENNLSETAFLVPEADGYGLRWFTPRVEVPLCGHATLASGFIVLTRLAPDSPQVRFHTRSGPLAVTRQGELYAMDLPAQPAAPCPPPPGLVAALAATPGEVHAADKYMAVFARAADVAALDPDMVALAALQRGVIATAPGDDCDFVSRFFAPAVGIPEDPVTGSAHCTLVPYWAARLGKSTLHARQISRRGGELFCELRGDRVTVAGRVAPYLEGVIHIPAAM